jgi:DNA-binding GntR family transcriptional regulator
MTSLPERKPGDREGSGQAGEPAELLPALEPLSVPSLRDRAREVIRAGIVAGKIEGGATVSVPALAASLGVSATPVREAVLDLAREGLLLPVKNKGFRVPTLSDAELQEIVELRLLLEVPTLAQLAGRLPRSRIDHYRRSCRSIEAAAWAGDAVEFLSADREFHLSLLSELGNGRLVEMVAMLRDQARLYGVLHLAKERQLAESAAEHREMLDAIVAGDAARVRRLMTKHLRHTRGIWAGTADVQPRRTRAN